MNEAFIEDSENIFDEISYTASRLCLSFDQTLQLLMLRELSKLNSGLHNKMVSDENKQNE